MEYFTKSKIEKVTGYTLLCGDKAIILILINNDHKSFFEENKEPFIYTEKEDFEVELEIPLWLKVKKVKEINYPEEKEVEYIKEKNRIKIPVEKLDITKVFLIEVERR